MFIIENNRENLWQWDINQRLEVLDNTINCVHFCNKTDDYALKRTVYEENGKRLVDIPNSLLHNCWTITVYAYDTNHTEYKEEFEVICRCRPEDYVYTDDDIRTWEELNKRIDEIEQNGVSQERIEEVVNAYLDENPIEAGATAEEAAQIEANKNAIASLQINAATKEYVDTAIENVNIDLTDYATKQYVDDAIANASLGGGEVDLSAYAKKTDIPTQVSVFINDAGYLTEHQSLEGYALKSDIPSLDGYAKTSDIPSLDGYAKTTDIPDVSNYQTRAQVEALIAASIPPSGEEVAY